MLHNRSEILKTKVHFQQLLANQLVTSLLVLDGDFNIVYANPAAEALLIKSLYGLYGTSFELIFAGTSINKKRLKQLLHSDQQFTDPDISIKLTANYHFTAEITLSSIIFDGHAHILLEFKQIDHQKNISAEISQNTQWVAARDLIKGLAHEIKNPLGGLRGAAQLLSKELTSEQQEYTQMIIEQSDRLTNLVDRLLGPNQLPKMEQHNIHSVLDKVCQIANYSHENQLHLLRDYDPSIPLIECDEEKLQQAVLNIVNNAILAISGDDSICIKTRVTSNAMVNGKRIKLALKISIIDTGPGIPKKNQDTLFFPMVSGRSNGTGLGLSISQTLINQHQGKLYFESDPGHTEFVILLPFEQTGT
jgi:two-component system nitrogen regulation sensor histidine kinase GlnL